jgi:DNA-directed RNA polymerase subunit RPC12/RpoP
MPIYKCVKCGRTVEKPLGTYYCKVCGPNAIMTEVSVNEKTLIQGSNKRLIFRDEGEMLERGFIA